MDPMKWEPLGTSAAAFAMIVLCRVAISRAHKKAAPLDAGGGSTGAAELEMDEATLVAFNRELGSWPGRSLFFGSFAYFAVQFFYQPDHMLASPYLLSMGLSFGAGVMVVTVVANIRVYLVSLRTDASKAHFARSLSWMVKMLYIAYLGSIVAFFVGFSMIGMIKPGFGQPFDRRFAVPICTGGIIGVAFSGYLTLARRQQPAHDVFKSEVSFTRLDNLELLYEDWRDLQQKQNDVFAAQVCSQTHSTASFNTFHNCNYDSGRLSDVHYGFRPRSLQAMRFLRCCFLTPVSVLTLRSVLHGATSSLTP